MIRSNPWQSRIIPFGMSFSIFFIVSCLLTIFRAEAKLVEVGPMTDQNLMIWIREDTRDQYTPTQLKAASAYTISSSDDADFSGGVNPTEVGLKSKGTEFGGIGSSDAIQDHWLFFLLPKKLKRGKTYSVDLGSLASTQQFTYNEFSQRCEAIHVSHYGYPPQSTTKYAYISQFMGDIGGLELEDYSGAAFHVIRDDNKNKVFSGTIHKRKDYQTGGPDTWNTFSKNQYRSYTMADVWECNFTPFQGVEGYSGKYRVVVEGMGCSYPFRIDENVYNDAYKHAMHALYKWRCGITCHKKGTVYKEMDSDVAEEKGNLTGKTFDNVWGGYHDAADCDANDNHINIARHLLWSYEMRPEIFTDGELRIPENNNGVPDILDEAAWVIAFFMRLQTPEGGVRVGKAPAGCSAPDMGCNAVWMPTRVHSFRYCAEALHLLHCMRLANVDKIDGPYYKDVDLSQAGLLASAQKAYNWALQQPENPKVNWRADNAPFQAHAWMFKVTGEKKYEDAFKKDNPITRPDQHLFPQEAPGEPIPYSMQDPAYIYLTTDQPNIDTDYQEIYRKAFDAWFTWDRIDASRQRGMRQSHHWRMPMVAGTQTTPQIIAQALAYFKIFPKQKRWLDICYPGLDWVLGGNQMNYCWMYQCGHRYPTSYAFTENPAKGLVIYGGAFVQGLINKNGNEGGLNFEVRTLYPPYRLWGDMEIWCENPYHCLTNEYTVHQTQAPMAAGMALFKDGGPKGLPLGNRPQQPVQLNNGRSHFPTVKRVSDRLVLTFESTENSRHVRLLSVDGRRLAALDASANAITVPLRDLSPKCYVLEVAQDGERSISQVMTVR